MSKTNVSGKRFLYRIAPHEVLKAEYPSGYYKFRNSRVAEAFWSYSLGSELLRLPTTRLVRESKDCKLKI